MKVAVVMMQKNERDLLSIWIKYHASIFGIENLFIIDNGSDDVETLTIMHSFKNLNTISRNNPRDFQRKGAVVQEILHMVCSDYDWAFLLDCDEFLCVDREGCYVNDKEAISKELDVVVRSKKDIARINKSIWNVPYSTYGYCETIKKICLKPSAKVDIDLGFHLFHYHKNKDSVDSNLFYQSNFCLIHFHNRPFYQLLLSAREKLKFRLPNFKFSTLKNYSGDGFHLIKYFFMSKDDYMSSFKKTDINIDYLFDKFSLQVPFSSDDYKSDTALEKSCHDPINCYSYCDYFNGDIHEVDFYKKLFEQHYSCLEYGLGAITRLACECGVQKIVSIETNIDNIHSHVDSNNLSPFIIGSRLKILHSNIGEVNEKGEPYIPSPEKILWHFQWIDEFKHSELLILNDLWSIPCAAYAYLHGNHEFLVVRDFFMNSAYNQLNFFYKVVHSSSRSAVIKAKPFCHTIARNILNKFLENIF